MSERFAQAAHLLGKIGGILTGAFALADLLGKLVALSFQRFDFGDGLAAAAIQIGEAAEQRRRVGVARAQGGFHGGQVGPHIGEIEHSFIVKQ